MTGGDNCNCNDVGDNDIQLLRERQQQDKRWCRGGEGRYSEYGVVGAEQVDESYFDDRSDADDDLEKGQIKFIQDKLYGRDDDVVVVDDTPSDSVSACSNNLS